MLSGIKKILSVETLSGFLLVGGINLILLIVFYYTGFKNSTFWVITLQLLLTTLIFCYAIFRKPRFTWNIVPKLVFTFFILWFLRVFYDSYIAIKQLSFEGYEYCQFAIFFSIIPFCYGNMIRDERSTRLIRNGILSGTLLFGCLVLALFFNYVNVVNRLGTDQGSVNPLFIGYIGAMNISYLGWKLISDKINIANILLLLVNIPLLGLGASRGSLVALVLSLFMVIVITRNINWKLVLLFIMVLVVLLNSELFGLGALTDRLTYYVEINTTSETKELRYYLWKYSIEKFMENPLTGASLEVIAYEVPQLGDNTFPHNLISEAFLSTGISGGIIMVSVIVITLKRVVFICRRSREDIWIAILFFIALYYNMFSGNLYNSAIWFWFLTGLINSRYTYLNNFNPQHP